VTGLALNACIALLPVLLFLAALVVMDTFKLAHWTTIVTAIVWGVIAALVSDAAYDALVRLPWLSDTTLVRYVAPVFEEIAKALFIVYMFFRRRVGFLVDSMVLGFAVGCGFALAENIAFLQTLGHATHLLWLVRGFGTAILHGALTATFAMVTKTAVDRRGMRGGLAFLPGLALVVVIHSAFNHLLLPPIAMTGLMLVIMPVLVLVVFQRSEHATREWVVAGLDLDIELLQLLSSDVFGVTKFGTYLESLKARFPHHVVVDMYCLLRVELELAIQAKGWLLAAEAGLNAPVHPDAAAALEEAAWLRRSIGWTGLVALRPLHVTTDRDAWHKHVLTRRRG
jgi:RsiW-degrading membrane proteinase PrsW (M82 family)